MNGIRLLSAAVAYSVVLLEVYSGVINGPVWWIVPGGLVIALLFAITMVPRPADVATSEGPGLGQWALILVLSFAMSGGAWYFGREVIPDLLSNPAFPLP